eukprot:scaffold66802_cov16-Tisochrysis_lutea.AAC.1
MEPEYIALGGGRAYVSLQITTLVALYSMMCDAALHEKCASVPACRKTMPLLLLTWRQKRSQTSGQWASRTGAIWRYDKA